MVVNKQPHEPFQQLVTLCLGQVVDALHVMAYSEDRFPASDGIGADHGVHGFENLADVLRRAARLGVDLEVVLSGSFVEFGLRVGRREAFEELLIGLRDPVVDFVPGCPEGVCLR